MAVGGDNLRKRFVDNGGDERGMIAQTLASMTQQVIAGNDLSREQAKWIVQHVSSDNLHDLFRGASQIRDHFIGSQVTCCSVVASKVGGCSEDCAFCSQSAHFDTHVNEVTKCSTDQIARAASEAANCGAQWFGIVASGLGVTDKEIEEYGKAINRIYTSCDIGICASLGILSASQAHHLAELGVQRYNHNLQTSRRHYPNIVTTHRYDERLDTLRYLKAAGISVCSGALFGMGETWDDRLDLACELRDVGVDVVPLNFLIPIEGTPLAQKAIPLEPIECLTIIALYRYLLPRQEIKIAGGREVCLRDLQSWIFHAGADGLMIGNYLTTCGRDATDDLQMIRDLGLTLREYGPKSICQPSPSASVPHDLNI